MKIEHITHGGTSLVRDSHDIELMTLDLLKDFQFFKGTKTLDFPHTNFKVKITSTEEGAMFDIVKGAKLGVTNFCCFRKDQKKDMIDLIANLTRQMPVLKTEINRHPAHDQFIYSIVIDPFAFNFEEIQTAGEIELYIYYSLYLAQNESK